MSNACALTARQMTYLEYAEGWTSEYDFDTLVDDLYWRGEFTTDYCLELMERDAKKDGVLLTNEDGFDYDKYFWDIYQTMEKGLS